MVVVMSRRIAVALYNEIAALRPDWHSDADEQGAMKIVMKAPRPIPSSGRATSATNRGARSWQSGSAILPIPSSS
jgi:type I restriction enzyme R subunit